MKKENKITRHTFFRCTLGVTSAFMANGLLPLGFVPHVLRCKNRGYGSVDLGQKVEIIFRHKNHLILKGGYELYGWHSPEFLYLVASSLDKQADVLLKGEADGKLNQLV